MDVQPPLIETPQEELSYTPETLSLFNYSGFLLPSTEYSTMLINFPSVHCNWQWGSKGNFFLSFTIYNAGKRIAKVHTEVQTQDGYFQVNLDDLCSLFDTPLEGYVHTQFHHEKTIPTELYISHIHRKTGAYTAYPALPFMGDKIHDPRNHTDELENCNFWPGVVINDQTELSLRVINPYQVPFSYQITLFYRDSIIEQSGLCKIRPFSLTTHSIEELFKGSADRVRNSRGEFSLSISAQYKLISFAMIRDRATGVYTTIDHLHRFCMY